jgi:hypothetical protein
MSINQENNKNNTSGAVMQTDNNRSLDTSIRISKELVDFVKKTNMSVQISGRTYLKAETWNFIFSQFNLHPRITLTKQTDKDTFKARCEVFDPDNRVICSGDALCSRREQSKRSFDDYALLSQAQTRALGKAGRLGFGWFVSLAGYEPTPAEEMTAEIVNSNEPNKAPTTNTEQNNNTDKPTVKQRQALYKFGISESVVDAMTFNDASNKLGELIENAQASKKTNTTSVKPSPAQNTNNTSNNAGADVWEKETQGLLEQINPDF